MPLRGLAHASLRGLAWDADQHRLYTVDTATDTLYAVDAAGTFSRS